METGRDKDSPYQTGTCCGSAVRRVATNQTELRGVASGERADRPVLPDGRAIPALGWGFMARDQTTGSARVPLLRSKLAVPPPPSGMVARTRLYELLDETADKPLVLLSAPAGWGKTTLLSGWTCTGHVGSAIAWLTVEPDDRGDRFWWYVSAALAAAGVAPASRQAPRDVRPAGPYLASLAQALSRLPCPVTLILDDMHRLHDARVLAGLEFLVAHTPRRLRLVLSTRVDPAFAIHRWRLSGQLTELRTAHLAFTETEAAALLAAHGHTLTAGQLAALHAETEGWPAGLRCAALELHSQLDHDQFLTEFSGEHGTAADYLRHEVLQELPPKERDLLRDAAVLTHLCGELVDAVAGRADGERSLADLEHRNAFISPLGGRPPWYRLHPLLADLLRAELRQRTPERIPELHRRAAAWHAAHGRPAEALRHALEAQDWTYATQILGARWPDLMLCGNGTAPYPDVPPPPLDALEAHPELILAYAAHRLNLGDRTGAEAFLQLAERHRRPPAHDRGARLALITTALKLTEAQLDGDVDDVHCYAPQVLAGSERLPDGGGRRNEAARALALSALGTVHQLIGDVDTAEQALRSGLSAAQYAGLTSQMWLCAAHLAVLHAMRGELRTAERIAHAVLSGAPLPQSPPAPASHAYLAMASVCYQRDQLDEAERYLDLAARAGGRIPEPLFVGAARIYRALILQARGDVTRADQVLRASHRNLAEPHPSTYLRHWLVATEADLKTCRGDTAGARTLLAPLVDGAEEQSPWPTLSLARAHLHDDDPDAALALLRGWGTTDAACRTLASSLEGGVLEAAATSALGDNRRAGQLLEDLLRLAEPEDSRRVFVQAGAPLRPLLLRHLDSGTAHWSMVMQLLDAAHDRTAAVTGRQPPGDPLTSRETTVLRYLQGTLSNIEIAAELSLSLHTVKTHLRSIYRKLGVAHRREAVRKAREQQLL